MDATALVLELPELLLGGVACGYQLRQVRSAVGGRAIHDGGQSLPLADQVGSRHRREVGGPVEVDRELLRPAGRQSGPEDVEAVALDRRRVWRAFEVVLEFADGDDVVAEPTPAERDVAQFLVQVVGGEQERPVARHPLGLVHRRRVGMGEVAGIEVVGWEGRPLSGGERDRHRPLVEVDVVDDTTRAVADAEASVVAEGHHLVTALVGKPSNGQLRAVESTGRRDDGASASVQAGDVLVA